MANVDGTGSDWQTADAAGQLAWSGLHRAPSLRDLVEPELWDRLVRGAETIVTPAGEMVHAHGQAPILVVVSGTARVFLWTSGGRQVTLRYVRPGDAVGLGAALMRQTTAITAEAVSHTTFAVLSLGQIKSLAAEHPGLSWVIATQVAAWAEDAVFAVLDLEHRPIIARIAGHILELADGTRDGRIIAYVSHKRLADIAGTAREVVTRSLRQLREAGLIETTPGTVSITDRFRLSAIARGDSELS